MSTELENPKISESPSAVAAPPAKEVVTANGSSARVPKVWQRRRFQVGAGILAALILAGILANNVIARQYTPDGAVRQYLGALQSGDSAKAWSQLQVSTSSTPVAASLLGESDLRAALGASRPDISSFDITSVAYRDDANAVVSVTIRSSNGSRQVQFLVQRSGDRRYGLYPVWRLIVAPARLMFAIPEGVGGVAVDGQALDLKAGTSDVAVLPLSHKVTFDGTSLLAAQTVTADASLVSSQTVQYQPTFSSDGLTKVKGAVSTYFNDVCAKQTSPSASGSCPQAVKSYLPYSGHWTLIGDRTQDVTIAMDKAQKIDALGHFQMVFGYTEDGVTGTRRVASGGGYGAQLTLTSADVKVDSIAGNENLPALTRPAGATDQAANDVVVNALKQCANISAETVANCPQAAPDVIIASVRWTLQGDPSSGATVGYDGKTGLLTVHGNFSMAVSYTWFGQARDRTSYITHYDAYLFWDGQTLQLITIDGAQS